MNVAFQGVHGAYSEAAARSNLGTDIATAPCETFAEVFDRVERRRSDRGVIPIENSLAGSIHENYDLLLAHALHIVGEQHERIEHALMCPVRGSLGGLTTVRSHPQALAQCSRFLLSHPSHDRRCRFSTPPGPRRPLHARRTQRRRNRRDVRRPAVRAQDTEKEHREQPQQLYPVPRPRPGALEVRARDEDALEHRLYAGGEQAGNPLSYPRGLRAPRHRPAQDRVTPRSTLPVRVPVLRRHRGGASRGPGRARIRPPAGRSSPSSGSSARIPPPAPPPGDVGPERRGRPEMKRAARGRGASFNTPNRFESLHREIFPPDLAEDPATDAEGEPRRDRSRHATSRTAPGRSSYGTTARISRSHSA